MNKMINNILPCKIKQYNIMPILMNRIKKIKRMIISE